MAGPWEDYKTEEAGPWGDYATPATAPSGWKQHALKALENVSKYGPVGAAFSAAGTLDPELSTLPGRAVASIPGNAKHIGGQLLDMLKDPAGSAKALGGLGREMLRTRHSDNDIMGVYGQDTPDDAPKPMLEAMARDTLKKYGGYQNIKDTFANRPLDMAMDALTVMPMGSAAKAPAMTVQAAERARLLKVLTDAGVPVSAGVKTNNPTLRLAEDTVAKLPGGQWIAKDPNAGRMEALTRAALERSGSNATAGTHDVLKAHREALGEGIGKIQAQHPIPIDAQFLNDLAEIEHAAPTLNSGEKAVTHFTDKLTEKPVIDPMLAQRYRTQLNRAIGNAEGDHKAALIDLKGALDDGLERAMQVKGATDDITALKKLRQQYANTMTLTDALHRSGAAGDLGTLTPTALKAALSRSVGKSQYMNGAGDLNDLATASSALLRAPNDTMTATRDGILNPVKWALSIPGQLAVNSRPAQAAYSAMRMPSAHAQRLLGTVPYQLSKVEAE